MKKTVYVLVASTLFFLLAASFGVLSQGAQVIEIGTAEQLRKIGTDSNYPLSADYKLVSDIDVSGAPWTPLGNDGKNLTYFTGTFDGQGYTISGLTAGTKSTAVSWGKDGWGLFGGLRGGAIRNLRLTDVCFNVYVSGNYNAVGTVAGYINDGTVENVYVSGFVRDTGSRQARIGGIVGSSTGGSGWVIRNCYADVDLVVAYSTASGSNFAAAAGGILGNAQVAGSVRGCLFTGTVSSPSYAILGHIVSDYMGREPLAAVQNCYSAGILSDSNTVIRSYGDDCELVTNKQLLNGYLLDKLPDSAWDADAGCLPTLILLNPVPMPSQTEAEALAAAKKALESAVVTNYSDADELLLEAESILLVHHDLAVENFRRTYATHSAAGEIRCTLRVGALTEDVVLTVEMLPSFTYKFSTNIPGRADGKVTVVDENGKNKAYSLHWGTEDGLLEGFGEIADREDIISDRYLRGTLFYSMEPMTLIPSQATRLYLCLDGKIVSEIVLDPARKLPESNLKYTFGALSDLHFGKSTTPDAFRAAMKMFRSVQAKFAIASGDISSSGLASQYKEYTTAQAEFRDIPLWVSAGNHDTLRWNISDTISPAQALANLKAAFPHFANENHSLGDEFIVSAPEGTNVYDYTMTYDGDLFLFMGIGAAKNDSETNVDQRLSNSQLEWLDDSLNDYYNVQKKSGQAFLIFHYYTLESGGSVTGTEWNSESSRKLHEILCKYDGVLYFNGHNHTSFGADANVYVGKYVSFHIPCFFQGSPKGGEGAVFGNEGYVVDVYEDYVLVKGYNFMSGEYFPSAMFCTNVKEAEGLVEELAAVDPSDEPVQISSGKPSFPWGWIVLCCGLAILAAGGVFVVLGIKKKKS